MTSSAEFLLGTRSIYILPNRYGWLFALLLAALLLGAVNYNNALAYLLTFLLASLAVVSLLHTQRNLLHLRVTTAAGAPVFAGELAHFRVCLQNNARERRALRITAEHTHPVLLDVPSRDSHCGDVTVAAARRGWLACPPLSLATDFPLGITHAWTRKLHFPARVLVYPAPATEPVASTPRNSGDGEATPLRAHDGDDFSGLRAYQPGDPASRIHWKTLARGQGLHTKEFAALQGDEPLIDWDDFAPLETENRLSAMTRAVLDAEQAGGAYGVRVPGSTITPGAGRDHLHRCLKSLALYEQTP